MAIYQTESFKEALGSGPTNSVLWVGAGLSTRQVRQFGGRLPSCPS